MAAVGQHLSLDLTGQQRPPATEQFVVVEEHPDADEGLQVLDEVVAADVQFEVCRYETSVQADLLADVVFDVGAPDELVEHSAQHPGA